MAGYNDISLPAELVTTQSNNFSVKMIGKAGVGRKSVFAFIKRQKLENEEQEVQTIKVSVPYWEVY
jgi:hypothetical protein